MPTHDRGVEHDSRRAKATGLAIAAVGIVIFNIAPFFNWVNPEEGDPRTGYETDSLVPFIAYLGLGLLVALVYAGRLARRGQHRGLTLVTMAVGIAATLQCLAFGINPMGGLERGDNLGVDFGVWIGFIELLSGQSAPGSSPRRSRATTSGSTPGTTGVGRLADRSYVSEGWLLAGLATAISSCR